MKQAPLPGWVVDEAESVREECARYRTMSGEEKMAVLAALLRDAERILGSRPDAQRARDWVDPLPPSTLQALSRLRAEAKSKRGTRP